MGRKNGFTIVEVVVAIAIVGIVVTAVTGLLSGVLRAMGEVGARTEASYLAQEGVELVRNFRDANMLAIRAGLCDPFKNPNAWAGEIDDTDSCPSALAQTIELTTCTDGCRADYTMGELQTFGIDETLVRDISSGFYVYGSGSPTPYTRKITIEPQEDLQEDSENPGVLHMLEVTVEVSWEEGRRVVASTELYNWLKLPPPLLRLAAPPSSSDPGCLIHEGSDSYACELGLPQGEIVDIVLNTDQTAYCRYSEGTDARFTDPDMEEFYAPKRSLGAAPVQNDHQLNDPLVGFMVPADPDFVLYIRCEGWEALNTSRFNPNTISLEIPVAD